MVLVYSQETRSWKWVTSTSSRVMLFDEDSVKGPVRAARK
jgi:hypothetical protein